MRRIVAAEGRGLLQTFFGHLEEARRRLKVVIICFLIAFAFFLTFSFQYGVVGLQVWLPVPSFNSREVIASQFFNAVSAFLIPGTVIPIVTTPWEGVMVQFKVALFLAAVAISPVTTYEFWAFVAPGLKPKERALIAKVSVPVVVLFVAGVVVSFLVVLPFTFSFLYSIAIALGAQPFLSLEQFLDFVLLFSLGFGIAFELPVIMYGLSVLGLVDARFWKRNWRYAAVGIFVFGAVITPDGSGVTMLIVAVPMLVLYAAGYGAIVLRELRTGAAKSS